jgi:hypothetical protein
MTASLRLGSFGSCVRRTGRNPTLKPVRVTGCCWRQTMPGRLCSERGQPNQQFDDNRTGNRDDPAAFVSPSDGYTILVYSQTMLANAHLYQAA